jgi:hypothetical protein
VTLADASGVLWNFDLTPIAGLTLNVSGSAGNFSVSPCGVAAGACVPALAYAAWPYAPAVQWLDAPPPCDGPDAPVCVNAATNETVCCSGNCEPLGMGVPQWQLLAAQDAVAGLVLAFDVLTVKGG